VFRLTLQTIRARKGRFVLTAVAVVLGVAFMAGTLVLADTINRASDGISATKFAGTDAVVQSRGRVDNGQGGTTRGTIPSSVVDTVRRVDGVAGADSVVDGSAWLVRRDGKLIDDRSGQATPIGMAWPTTRALNPLHLVAGHAPTAAGDVVIDRASARTTRFAPGDSVRVLTPSGSAQYTVSGIATYGSADDAGGAGVVAFTPAAAARVLGDPGRVDSVRAVAAAGVSPSELVTRIRSALAGTPGYGGVEVITGQAALAAARHDAHQGIAFMSVFLLVFAVVALVVGGFVIFNSFSITVAQRTRETAMLRAIGSSRRQVLRSVVGEAVVIGLAASATGVAAGIGLARGLFALLESFGVELPSGSIVVQSTALAVPMVVGTLVTVAAAYLPARRASKIAPVAAMREVAIDGSGGSRGRAVAGLLLTGLGIAAVAAGVGGDGAAALVGFGALAVFAGVITLGPAVGSRFVRLVGAPIAAVRGTPAALARDNAARNPKRTAATASALAIGVALVVLISVFAASARASIDANINHALRSDWIITPLQSEDGLSPSVARSVDALPQTASVTTFRVASATHDGSTVQVSGIDPATVGQHLDLGVKHGAVTALGMRDIGVLQQTAKNEGLHVGDDVTMTFPQTGVQHFRVAMIYGLQDPLGDYTMSQQAFDANVAHVRDQAVFVLNTPGVSQQQARTAIGSVLAATPTARLHTPAEFEAEIAGRIDQLLNLIYVLLLLAVLIALFGVANTLALSVVERRRELGLLRAVGMQRRQLRASVRWEAVLVALLGTALGAALGVGFGIALVKAVSTQGIDHLAVPVVRLAVIMGAGAAAAVLAAALPARRAARLDVLKAIGA
jgi:putative ABC transport system permease protein